MAKKQRAAASKGSKPRSKPKTSADAPGAQGAAGIGHNEPPKLTADQMQELFLQHRTSWNQWQAKVKALEEIERDVKAALKADGFTVKQFQLADQLLTVKGEKKVKEEVGDRLKVARWLGLPMGSQLDLFTEPDRTPAVDRAFDNGKRASMQNEPRKAPHAPETEQARNWYLGYDEHQAELQSRFKKPGEDDKGEPDPGPTKDDPPVAGERVSRSEFKRRIGAMAEHDNGAPPQKPH